MTLDEKISYLSGDRDFYIRPVERLGIPEIKMSDGPSGCRNWGPSTAYPAAIALAASFDRALAREVGRSLARDCRARGVHILLAPGVNIARSPLGGRNFEYLGEDPLLARGIATEFITAVQAAGVLSTVKHFALNNQEWDRRRVSSEVSERTLREIYLPAFEGAVKDAHVGAVMTAYNLVNGTYASHHAQLIRGILKTEWGFSGFVMSDWAAIQDTEMSLVGGVDLEMPGAEFWTPEKVLPLLRSGAISEELIDEKVVSILRTLISAGFLDRQQTVPRPIDDPESRKIALLAAQRSLVLLKNEPPLAANGSRPSTSPPLLPLPPGLRKLAVVGPNAHPAVAGASGSAYVTPAHSVSLVEALQSALPDTTIVTHPGVQQQSGYETLGAPVFTGPVRQEIFAGTSLQGAPLTTTVVDRVHFVPQGKAPAAGVGAENYSIRWSGDLLVPKHRSYRFLAHADDGVRVFVDGKLILSDWSDHAPRMTVKEVALTPGTHHVVVEYFQGTSGAICQFGFEEEGGVALLGANGLRSALAGADAVVVVVGFGQHTSEGSLRTPFEPFWPPPWAREAGVVEAEDDDRPFQLPRAQLETIALATASNPRTVVVGFAGGGVDFEPWLAQVPALLWAWYPGQEGGTALADVLLGKESPNGRLPVTFAKRYSDHPSSSSYHLRTEMGPETEGRGPRLDFCPSAAPLPTATDSSRTTPSSLPASPPKSPGPLFSTPYCEGLFTGYRGFDQSEVEPLFPFGFGLTYTHFSFDALETHREEDGAIRAIVRVTNRGSRKGRAVVQIYVAPLSSPESAVQKEPRAPQQLAGYAIIELEASASRDVSIPLASRAFSVYRPGRGWVLPAGSYEVRASSSSRAHHQKAVLPLEESWESAAARHSSASDLRSRP